MSPQTSRLSAMRWARGKIAVAAGALAAALACAPPASARIVQAQDILPPGESGFVSIAGLPNGTGSPHLYDQQAPFIAFERKNDMLALPGTEQDPRTGVRIIRDGFGVPSIYASNDPDAWWGAGYATAQDRLFELELFRRATTGHLAEILGKDYLSADIETRRDFYTPAELDAMLAKLPAELQRRYTAYRDGINAWIQHVETSPTDMPGEFVATADVLRPFSVEDLLAIGVYLARTTPNTDGSDLDNARALDELGPARFDQILPLRIAGQVSTIPRSDGLFPSVPGRTRADERAARTRSAAFVRQLPLPSGDQPSGSPSGSQAPAAPPLPNVPTTLPSVSVAIPRFPIHVGGSSMIAVGDRRHRRAFLFSGPELGFSAPEELYELEVHRPGLDVRGITAPGAPVIAIGHNRHVAWGVTSGLSQTNALYAERLLPGQGEQYVFRGQTKTMSCRNETFSYRSAPTDLLSGKVPTLGSETVRLCRTLHGPVQARASGIAYARRYATWTREEDTLSGLAAVDDASSIQQVDRAAAKLSWNENLMAADDQGNIGYWHPGLLPIRPKDWDERLPYPGTGEAEWRGMLPVAQRPHVIDPQQGWLTNWNNIPSQGWTTGNDPASERVAGPFFRSAFMNALVRRIMLPHPSFTHLEQTVRAEGSTAEQRSLAAPELRKAVAGAGGPAAAVLRTILAWDGSYTRTDANGTLDPGVAAWQQLKDELQAIALSRLGPGSEIIGGGEPNDEHVYDVSLGQAYALRVLSPTDFRTAAANAFAKLSKRFNSTDPEAWRDKRAMFPESSLGAESPPPMPFFDRGTWEQLVELHG
jgi:penicillin G amidase